MLISFAENIFPQIDQPDFHFPTDWNNNTNKSKFNSQVQLDVISSLTTKNNEVSQCKITDVIFVSIK